MLPEGLLGGRVAVQLFVPVAFALFFRLRLELSQVKPTKSPSLGSGKTRKPQVAIDPRILEAIKDELDEAPKYILEVGSGLGDRSRYLAEMLGSTVVALEIDASLSSLGAQATRKAKLEDAVWHVRTDDQLSVDPQDMIEGQLYNVVIISAQFARRKGVLAWAAIALEEGGVMIVEGDLGIYGFMKFDLGMEFVRVCRGGTLESVECVRRLKQNLIAENETSVKISEPAPYLLLCGRRNDSQAPLQVRTRTMSAITFAPPQVRTRRLSSVESIKKVNLPRQIDSQGLRTRVGCICMVKSPRTGGLDISRIVVVSSSKRPGEWIVPAGHIEKGEKAKAAAEREAFEEAGVKGSIVSFLTRETDKLKGSTTDFFLMAVEELDDDFPEADHRRVFLLHIDDVLRSVFSEPVRKALFKARELLRASGAYD